MKHISAALQTETMILEQMRKENIRRIGINSVLFLSIHYPVKWLSLIHISEPTRQADGNHDPGTDAQREH